MVVGWNSTRDVSAIVLPGVKARWKHRQGKTMEITGRGSGNGHILRVRRPAARLRAGGSRCSLLIQDWLAHDRILAGHSATEGAFHLRAKGQLVQVFRLLCCGYKALCLQRLVLETLQAITKEGDISSSRISAG